MFRQENPPLNTMNRIYIECLTYGVETATHASQLIYENFRLLP